MEVMTCMHSEIALVALLSFLCFKTNNVKSKNMST